MRRYAGRPIHKQRAILKSAPRVSDQNQVLKSDCLACLNVNRIELRVEARHAQDEPCRTVLGTLFPAVGCRMSKGQTESSGQDSPIGQYENMSDGMLARSGS